MKRLWLIVLLACGCAAEVEDDTNPDVDSLAEALTQDGTKRLFASQPGSCCADGFVTIPYGGTGIDRGQGKYSISWTPQPVKLRIENQPANPGRGRDIVPTVSGGPDLYIACQHIVTGNTSHYTVPLTKAPSAAAPKTATMDLSQFCDKNRGPQVVIAVNIDISQTSYGR